MREYLLVPKSQWHKLSKTEMPLDEVKKLFGAFNPDDSEHIHGTGRYNVPRNVTDFDYWSTAAVTNKIEDIEVAKETGGVISKGIFYPGKDSSPSIVRDKFGNVLFSDVRLDYPGRSILSSLYEAGETVNSWLTGKQFDSPYPDLEVAGGAPRFYENVIIDTVNIPSTKSGKGRKNNDKSTDEKAVVATREKKIWGPKNSDIISEDDNTSIKIKDDLYHWIAPLEKLVGGSLSGTLLEKILKPLYNLPLSPGLNSGYTVTVPDVNGRDIDIYTQIKKYIRLGALLGRHESDITLYKDTDNESTANVKVTCGFWDTFRILNPYFYLDNAKMMISGTPTEFPGGRYRLGNYDLGYFSPVKSIKISREDENGETRAGEITVTDTLPHSDQVFTVWKYITGKGSLLFKYNELDQDKIYQNIITSRIWHVDPIVSHNMGKSTFIHEADGKIRVEYPDTKNLGESKVLGRFKIEDDTCYFQLEKDKSLRYLFSDRSDIEIGKVRHEDGYMNVYTDKEEVGRIVSQLNIKNIEEATYFKNETVDTQTKSPWNISKYIPSFDILGDLLGDIPFLGIKKTNSDKRDIAVPYADLDKILTEQKAHVLIPENQENAIEYMSMLIALCGVGAEDIGLVSRGFVLKDLDIYKLPRRVDRCLDLITTTEKTHNPSLKFENVISVLIGPNLLPNKMALALDDMLGIKEPEELKSHRRDMWHKNRTVNNFAETSNSAC